MKTKVRVLVVDDSAFARTVLTKMLRADPEIDVIGTARDGADALEQIATHDPDVITLDLTMPNVDGLEVLRTLAGRKRPRAIIVSSSLADSEPVIEALALGATSVVTKPSALATDRLYEVGHELAQKIRAIGEPPPPRREPDVPPLAISSHGVELVVIGTSTGGPQALTRLLASLPGDLSAPVAMVLHIPVGYTEALAKRLDALSALEVVEAYDGVEFRRGRAVLAKAGMHLRVVRRDGKLVGALDMLPPRAHVPAVDELFLSAAEVVGSGTLGIVLTGMGDDGLAGSRAIAGAGGQLVTESASSCVVYGMPRVVFEAGLGAREAPLDLIHSEITAHVAARP